jgi:hypothetical protein
MKKQIIYTFDELKQLSRQCGVYSVAKHMQHKGYSLETTLYILLQKSV